jgi:NAD(P)-dependent dehydrogenase (short-subunit alcohol dehydrogenase family)
VNAISPGVIIEAPDSPAAAGAGLMSSAPAGRPGTPAEIGAAAVFLAGEESAFVQGAVLDVDGGRSHVLETAR